MRLGASISLLVVLCAGCDRRPSPTPAGPRPRFPDAALTVETTEAGLSRTTALARGGVASGELSWKNDWAPGLPECKAAWRWLGTTDNGDVYEFTLTTKALPWSSRSPTLLYVGMSDGSPVYSIVDPSAQANKATDTVVHLAYKGSAIRLLDDHGLRITLHPAGQSHVTPASQAAGPSHPVYRVRLGDGDGATGPSDSDLLKGIAERTGGATLPAGILDRLRSRIATRPGGASKPVIIITITDGSLDACSGQGATRPADP